MSDTATKPAPPKTTPAKKRETSTTTKSPPAPPKPAKAPSKAAAKRPAMTGRSSGKATLGQAPASPPPSAAGELPLDAITPTHWTNPRGDIDPADPGYQDTYDSVKAIGILQPIVVGPALAVGDNAGKHPIIVGWTRFHIASALRLESIPVRQVAMDDAKATLVAAIAENVARNPMRPLAEARALDKLIREHGMTQVEAGRTVGMAERTVRERLRLLKIEETAPDVAAAIDAGTVPMDAAVALQAIAAASPTTAADLVAQVSAGAIAGSQLANQTSLGELLREDLTDGLVALDNGTMRIDELPVDETVKAAYRKADADLKKFGIWHSLRATTAEITKAAKGGVNVDGTLFSADRSIFTEVVERNIRDIRKQLADAAASRPPRPTKSDEEAAAEAARKAEEARVRDAAQAGNLALGRQLDALTTVKLTPAVGQLLAACVFDAVGLGALAACCPSVAAYADGVDGWQANQAIAAALSAEAVQAGTPQTAVLWPLKLAVAQACADPRGYSHYSAWSGWLGNYNDESERVNSLARIVADELGVVTGRTARLLEARADYRREAAEAGEANRLTRLLQELGNHGETMPRDELQRAVLTFLPPLGKLASDELTAALETAHTRNLVRSSEKGETLTAAGKKALESAVRVQVVFPDIDAEPATSPVTEVAA